MVKCARYYMVMKEDAVIAITNIVVFSGWEATFISECITGGERGCLIIED